MGAVLYALLCCLSFLHLVWCGEKTPACSKCNWSLRVKTCDKWWSGTDSLGYLDIWYEDGTYPNQILLKTSGNDLYGGGEQTFKFDINPDKPIEIVKYRVKIAGIDQWEPDWMQLRNEENPFQSSGTCEIGCGQALDAMSAVCCNPNDNKWEECDGGNRGNVMGHLG